MNFETYYELTQLYARYASALGAADWEAWPEFFIEDCVYKLQPRENHERGFPLATLAFDSKGMLKDRVYGIRETLFHDPYYQRHVVGAPLVHKVDAEGRIHSEANYAVLRTAAVQGGHELARPPQRGHRAHGVDRRAGHPVLVLHREPVLRSGPREDLAGRAPRPSVRTPNGCGATPACARSPAWRRNPPRRCWLTVSQY